MKKLDAISSWDVDDKIEWLSNLRMEWNIEPDRFRALLMIFDVDWEGRASIQALYSEW